MLLNQKRSLSPREKDSAPLYHISNDGTHKAAVFKVGSADQRGSATGSHGVRERIPKSSNCLHGF